MNSIKHAVFVLLSISIFAGLPVAAQETTADHYELKLSPRLMELLRAEMKAIVVGVQYLPVGIAAAEWHKVAKTGEQISASYILEQKLTPAMRTELDTALPGHFKRLDMEFHHEAKKLQSAAMNHNAQLAAFHYYRLIEACTECHAAFAVAKFPGFAAPARAEHRH